MSKKRVVIGRITKPCETCGMHVDRPASEFREHVFCSRKCYWSSPYHSETVAAANAKRNPVDTFIEKPCEHCGEPVRRQRSQYRNRAFCSRVCKSEFHAARAARRTRADGYVEVYVGTHYPGASKAGLIREHRKIVQEILGRPLLPEENVHHINGVRDDNRPENLELWSKSQPPGQRVADKLAWARDFIALYEGENNMI